MAGNLTNTGEELALNMLFRNTGTKPSNIYMGLATDTVGNIDESTGLSGITEVDDAGYQRLEVVFDAPVLDAGKETIQNSAQLEFGPWDTDEDAGVTYAFLCDASSGTTGDLLALYELPSMKSPLSGESLIVTAGNLTFNID